MPKETLYERVRSGYVQREDGAWTPEEEKKPTRRFEVGWHESTVQVAVTVLRPGVDRDDEHFISKDENGEDELHDAWEGQWLTIDNRHQINELIRMLRRARDKAFGRDE